MYTTQASGEQGLSTKMAILEAEWLSWLHNSKYTEADSKITSIYAYG